MDPRSLFVVLVRAGALLFGLYALSIFAFTLGMVLDSSRGSDWALVAVSTTPVAAAIVVALSAEALAPRRREPAPQEPASAAEIRRVVLQSIGIYALLRAVTPLSTLVAAVVGGSGPVHDEGILLFEWGFPTGALVQFVAYVALGLVLVLGPGRTWRGLRKTFVAPRPGQGGGTEESP